MSLIRQSNRRDCPTAPLTHSGMTDRFDHLVKKHPCFDGEAHFKYGRIHLPVSPACNIRCRFCIRSLNEWENRPGVTRSIITPEEAVRMVSKALDLCPDITVIGIAGPGDTLATDHALDTFRSIGQDYPHLIKCLSTNGLRLSEKARQVMEAGVKTVTVTVNAIRPEILTHICSGIVYEGRYIEGREGAHLLISNQLRGIREIRDLGVMVKINTVLIPGINDTHIEELARVARKLGASMMNVLPLIPQGGMRGHPAPDCHQLALARAGAEQHLPVFRHCRQCRADACGVPGKGKDLSHLLYERPLPLETFSHG